MILLVIDMQKALVDEELFNYETFVDSTVRLVEAARKNRVEVIFVQHDAGPGTGLTVGDEGFEIIDELRPEPGEKVFSKPSTAASAIRSSRRISSSRMTGG